jgi:hypothetical protein
VATVPMADSEWATLLEQVGLVPRPRARVLGSWHYCRECRRLVEASRVAWWAPSSAPCQFESRDGQRNRASRPVASATVTKEER